MEDFSDAEENQDLFQREEREEGGAGEEERGRSRNQQQGREGREKGTEKRDRARREMGTKNKDRAKNKAIIMLMKHT